MRRLAGRLSSAIPALRRNVRTNGSTATTATTAELRSHELSSTEVSHVAQRFARPHQDGTFARFIVGSLPLSLTAWRNRQFLQTKRPALDTVVVAMVVIITKIALSGSDRFCPTASDGTPLVGVVPSPAC
jgi:hypothetical protein